MLEGELFALLGGTTDAAFTVTEGGEILSWNKGAEKLFGYPGTTGVHKTCYEILEGLRPLGTRVSLGQNNNPSQYSCCSGLVVSQ